jgi:hypothetical protein
MCQSNHIHHFKDYLYPPRESLCTFILSRPIAAGEVVRISFSFLIFQEYVGNLLNIWSNLLYQFTYQANLITRPSDCGRKSAVFLTLSRLISARFLWHSAGLSNRIGFDSIFNREVAKTFDSIQF